MHPCCKIPIQDIRTLVQQQSHAEGQKTENFKELKPGQLYCPDCGGLLIVVTTMIPSQSELYDSG
jgi:hypothetical protein